MWELGALNMGPDLLARFDSTTGQVYYVSNLVLDGQAQYYIYFLGSGTIGGPFGLVFTSGTNFPYGIVCEPDH